MTSDRSFISSEPDLGPVTLPSVSVNHFLAMIPKVQDAERPCESATPPLTVLAVQAAPRVSLAHSVQATPAAPSNLGPVTLPSVSVNHFLAMIPKAQDAAERACESVAPSLPVLAEQAAPRAWLAHGVQASSAAPSSLDPTRVDRRTRSFNALIPAAFRKDPAASPPTPEAPLPPTPRLKRSETESRAAYLTATSQQRAEYLTKPAVSTKHLSAVMQGVLGKISEKASADRRDRTTQHRQRFDNLLNGETGPASLPDVRVRLPAEAPEVKVARIVAASDFPISKGAYRLFTVLYELATQLHTEEVEREVERALQSATTESARNFRRGMMREQLQTVPNSFLFHCPQEFIAALVKYNVRHVRRLSEELVAAGLIASSAISEPLPRNWERKDLVDKPQTPEKESGMYTGMLYRVRLQDDCREPLKLVRADYRRRYRDLEHDTLVGRTPKLWMSELHTILDGQVPTLQQLRHAVCAFITHNPLEVARTSPLRSLQDVVYLLGDLQAIQGVQQAIQVDRLARSLSQALNDADWHRWWCKQLWQAIKNQTLGCLAAQLERLGVDAREWAQAQHLGAVFAARQRATVR